MPQVQLNTRVDIDTYTKLKQVSEKLNKSIASIVDEALNQYFEEVSPMKGKCPNCNSLNGKVLQDDGEELVQYKCDDCGHEWTEKI